jgi:hypothetical protein
VWVVWSVGECGQLPMKLMICFQDGMLDNVATGVNELREIATEMGRVCIASLTRFYCNLFMNLILWGLVTFLYIM